MQIILYSFGCFGLLIGFHTLAISPFTKTVFQEITGTLWCIFGLVGLGFAALMRR